MSKWARWVVPASTAAYLWNLTHALWRPRSFEARLLGVAQVPILAGPQASRRPYLFSLTFLAQAFPIIFRPFINCHDLDVTFHFKLREWVFEAEFARWCCRGFVCFFGTRGERFELGRETGVSRNCNIYMCFL